MSLAFPALGLSSTFTAAINSTCGSASQTSGSTAVATVPGPCPPLPNPPIIPASTSGNVTANSNGLEAGAGAAVYGNTAASVQSTASADWSITGLHLVGSNLSSGGSLQLVVAASGSISQVSDDFFGLVGSASGSIVIGIQGSANGGSAQTLLSNTIPYSSQATPINPHDIYDASYGPVVVTSSLFSFAPGDTDALTLSLSAIASASAPYQSDASSILNDTLQLVSINYLDSSGNPIFGDSLADDSGNVFALNQPLIVPEPSTLVFLGFGLVMVAARIGFAARKLS